jgi:hypothetical protein
MMRKFVLLALCLATLGAARAQDGFGLWTSAELSKKVSRGFKLSVEGDFRMDDNLKTVDRWDLGVGADVRLLSFLRFGAEYIYLRNYNPATTKIKSVADYDDGYYVLNRNSYASSWSHRHRFCMDLTASVTKSRFTFSLRERYQYTYEGSRSVARTKDALRYSSELNPETGTYDFVDIIPVEDTSDGTKDYDSGEKNALRQRLKVEYNTRKCKWDPYASVEIVNELDDNFTFKKMRYTVGVDYKINKQNTLSIGYLYQRKFAADLNFYALSIGYSLKLK